MTAAALAGRWRDVRGVRGVRGVLSLYLLAGVLVLAAAFLCVDHPAREVAPST
jgi:hypothetical protein